jgi:hypothetical protein
MPSRYIGMEKWIGWVSGSRSGPGRLLQKWWVSATPVVGAGTGVDVVKTTGTRRWSCRFRADARQVEHEAPHLLR